jgi:hypothetical protein
MIPTIEMDIALEEPRPNDPQSIRVDPDGRVNFSLAFKEQPSDDWKQLFEQLRSTNPLAPAEMNLRPAHDSTGAATTERICFVAMEESANAVVIAVQALVEATNIRARVTNEKRLKQAEALQQQAMDSQHRAEALRKKIFDKQK